MLSLTNVALSKKSSGYLNTAVNFPELAKHDIYVRSHNLALSGSSHLEREGLKVISQLLLGWYCSLK